jgi:S1-C subfamily serine protease
MTGTLAQISQELAELIETVAPRVMRVGGGNSRPRTGIRLGEGRIVSVAWHAVDDEEVPVAAADGSRWTARVSGFDPTSDLVLLQLPDDAATPAAARELGRTASAVPPVGSLAVAVAHPSGEGIEARLEMVRCLGGAFRLSGGRRIGAYLQTDGRAFPGFAGAGLFSPAGELVGITVPQGPGVDPVVVPAGDLVAITDALQTGSARIGSYLGVRTQPARVPADVADARETGLLVVDVAANSPAKAGGIMVGDILLSGAGVPLESGYDLWDLLQSHPADTELELKLVRAGSREFLRVTPSGRESR